MQQHPYNNIGECMLNEGFLDNLIGKTSDKTELDFGTIINSLKKAVDDLEIAFSRSLFSMVKFAFNKSYVLNFFLTNNRKYETTFVYKAILPIKTTIIFKNLGLSENLVMNELYQVIDDVDKMQPYFNINAYYTDIMQNEIEILLTLNENYCLKSYYDVNPKKKMSEIEAKNYLHKSSQLAISKLKEHPLGQFIPFNDKTSNIIDIDGYYHGKGKFISNNFKYNSVFFNNIEFKGMDIFLNLYYYLEDVGNFKEKYVCLGMYNESDSTGALYLRTKPNYEVK